MATKINIPKRSTTIVNSISDPSELSISHYGFETINPHKPYVDSTGYRAYRLHFVVKGGVFLHYKGKTIPLNANSFFILRPDLEIGYSPNPNLKSSLFWVAFTGKSAVDILDVLELNANAPYVTLPDDLGQKALRSFCNALNGKKIFPSPKMLNISLLRELYTIFESIYLVKPHASTVENSLNEYAQRTLEYVNLNYADPAASIHTIAKELALHPNYLSKILKDHLSMSFTQILTQKRIEVAMALFTQGETSVSSVAFKVGFKDPLYFSKVFKKVNGGYAPKGPRKPSAHRE